MHDTSAAAVASQGAAGDADRLSLALPGELPILVGRLRRWSSKRQWGYVFSELHSSDLILCPSECSETFTEGDFILFELWNDERGQPSARNARKASSEDVIAQQAQLATAYQNFYYKRLKVENLPCPSSSSALADVAADSLGTQQRGHQRGDRHAAQAQEAPTLQSPQMQLPPHLQETSLRPPPPPPVLPPAPHHSASAAAAGPEAFAAATAQQGTAYSQQTHQQQQLSHQGQYGTYANYVDDHRNYLGYQNGGMQGMSSPWTASEGGNHNSMREATTISLNDQMPGHVGMKILFEAPPLLHDGFNAKNGMASTIGREFGDLCRTTHNAFQHESPDQVAVEVDMSSANAWGQQQQWDWSSWGQGHADQMGHSSVGGYGGHAGMGHSVLSTQGDGGMYSTG